MEAWSVPSPGPQNPVSHWPRPEVWFNCPDLYWHLPGPKASKGPRRSARHDATWGLWSGCSLQPLGQRDHSEMETVISLTCPDLSQTLKGENFFLFPFAVHFLCPPSQFKWKSLSADFADLIMKSDIFWVLPKKEMLQKPVLVMIQSSVIDLTNL